MKRVLPIAALCSIFFIGCGGAEKPAAEETATEATTETTEAAGESQHDLAKGKEIYDANCAACHAEGIMKAPKTGDVEAWTARIEQGMDTLVKKSIEGYNAEGMMPAKGGNPDLSDQEVADAVAYMVAESSAK
ncbi:cytochrome C [Prosthecochloris sp. GSB1]|uniref:c-type cytochrome n=1 Tax=Prosthecochloris sp. GSB1 TaxID=281093 RepID=UPI000B8CDC67|nr:c-type cytochrome [Prosthecochloris sp. GSB1]ASQ91383.1 cytochrome C [Prosthecochloris sp. GSB1]